MIVNLTDDIIPGVSAAGCQLGQNLKLFLETFENAIDSSLSSEQLQYLIDQSAGWVLYNRADGSGRTFFWQHGAVELHFDQADSLKWISVGKGYLGKLFDSIAIDDHLSSLTEICDLQYDSSDELHYSDCEKCRGVEFYADEESLLDSPDQRIRRIFISGA